MSSFGPRLSAAVVALGALTFHLPALACGGLFCDTQPVEQNGERILFEVNGDGTITSTVEIQYGGDPDSFSWVIPISDTPDLGVVSPSVLALLDTVSVPQIINPPVTCQDLFPPMPGATNDAESMGDDDDSDGVNVEDLPQVGPYQSQVVSSDDPVALINWLNDNDYLITDEMEPYVAAYVTQGMKFFAMRLAPDAGVADIQPIQLTYPGTEPMVPIVLTAVGAEPEMGILAFIAANERYESSNFANMTVDVADVQVDSWRGTNNYYPLISWMLNESGGRGMVTEMAAPAADWAQLVNNTFLAVPDAVESQEYVQNLLTRRSYVTRLYTRLSNHEMTLDPTFAPSAGTDVSRVLDLSDRPAVEVCSGPEPARVPCGDMYCGEGALCATTDTDIDGCVCGEGTFARSIAEPFGPGRFLKQTVTCASDEVDLLASVRAEGFGPGDACETASCGDNGTCKDLNGFPSCDCADGFAAVTDFSGAVTCTAVLQTFAPNQVVQWEAESGCGCSTTGDRSAGWLALLLLAPLARRRRVAA